MSPKPNDSNKYRITPDTTPEERAAIREAYRKEQQKRNYRNYFIMFIACAVCLGLMLIVPGILFDTLQQALPNATTGVTTPSGTTVPTGTTAPSITTAAPTVPSVYKVDTFTLSATGDMLMHMPVINAAATGSGYDFSGTFCYLKSYVQKADYAACNLETTLAGTNNGYSYSGYPNFNCPDDLLSGFMGAGFDLVLTANNHAYDTRTVGLNRTVSAIANSGLSYLGTQATAEEQDYKLVTQNGITLGLMCYTYEDNADPNKVAPNSHLMTDADAKLISTFNYNCLDLFYTEIQATLAQMEQQGADASVLFIHWGDEYQLKHNDTQSAMAQKLCDLGVDVIIGGHPHVVQPVELLESTTNPDHKTVCLYSMGNAVSNQRLGNLSNITTAHTEDGVLFSVTFALYSDGTVILESAELLPTWVMLGTIPATGKWGYTILPLDDSVTDWKTLFPVSDAMIQKAKDSYDRTMAIVGAGMADVDAWLTQHVADTEAQLGVKP